MVLICSSCYHPIHKGPARWDDAYNIEQARERGVLEGIYFAEPFEYDDSVFHLKLVFSEIYAVYWHWLDENDSTWKHTDHTYLTAVVDTSLSYGLDKVNVCNGKHWSNVKKYFTVNVSCFSFGTETNIIDLRPNDKFSDSLQVPVEATVTYNRTIHHSEQDKIILGRILFKKIEE